MAVTLLFMAVVIISMPADLRAFTNDSAVQPVFANQPLVAGSQPLGIKRYVPDQAVQTALSERPMWQDFLARNGGKWQVRWYPGTGTPHLVWGEGLPLLPQGNLAMDTVEKISRDFIRANSDLFMVDESELLLKPKSVNLGQENELWFVHFQRVVDGIPIYASDVYLRYKFGRLVQFGSDCFPDLAVDPAIEIDGLEALEIAQADCSFKHGVDSLEAAGDLLYFPVQRKVGGAFDYHLVQTVNIRRADGPQNLHYFIDAHDGTIIARWDYIFRAIDGTVTANVYERHVANPVTERPMPYLTVNISGAASVNTDIDGIYTSPAIGSHTISAELYGPYWNLNNQAGADASVSFTGAGVGQDIQWDDSNSTMAERTSYHALDRIRTLALNWIHPAWFDQRLPVNVNINDTCNAYYDYSSVNFFLAGGGCNNTGELFDVVAHEWGHGLDDNISGIYDGASSEGWSDVTAMMQTEDCLVGPYFHTDGSPVRNICDNYTYPEDTGEVHYEGQIIGSTNYDLLVYLRASLGDKLAISKLQELFFQHMYTSDHYLDDYDAYLVIDDDDGNLANYTPNFVEINTAFSEHGLTEYVVPTGVIFDHTPLADTPDTINPYEVVTLCTSITDTLDTGSLELRYQVDGGSFASVALSATGQPDEFHGYIPAQAVGASVSYYLYGEDAEGPGTLPRTAPGSTFSFLVGFSTIFFDDMESGEGGWTHYQVAAQDDWMLGSPGPNAYDPSSAYSGSNIWGNDLAPAGWNGNYYANVHNYIRSQVIDCSGFSGVRLRYMRWLTVEEAIYDQATIYVNGTQVWQNAAGADHMDTAWTVHDINISALADDNASVVIEYHMQSDSGVEFGGWNIDDFKLVGTSSVVPQETVEVSLDANPSSGVVPFSTQFTALLTNLLAGQSRQVAGRIDVAIGGGSSYTNWRSGWTNLSGGEVFTSTWVQSLPALGALIGDNVFTLHGADVTPAPFNQPPYAPSGDTDSASTTVTAMAP
jgi:hypothetical protein